MIIPKKVSDYFSLVKFVHTIFAFPFAMIGYFAGLRDVVWKFNPMILLYVVLCMIFARSAAMSFNRVVDMKFDKENPRTANREIPRNIIKPSSAIIFAVFNSILFVAVTFFINRLCFFLSPVVLIIILGYSYTKRFTSLCHLILGLGLAIAPVGAYLAVIGTFALFPVLLSFAVLFWVSGFDIIYALQDKDFDNKFNLHSIPALLGIKKGIAVSVILHLLSAATIVIAGIYGSFGIYYWLGSAIFISLLIYQHTLVKFDDLSKVNVAFFTLNGIASIFFSIFAIVDIL